MKQGDKMEMTCHLCYPNAKEFGQVIPDYWLMENEGRYALITYEGHKDHEIFYFPEKPTPDPDPECVLEEGQPGADWLDKVLDWSDTMRFRPCEGYHLIRSCKRAGYKRGDVLMWLYERAGKMLKEQENAENKRTS